MDAADSVCHAIVWATGTKNCANLHLSISDTVWLSNCFNWDYFLGPQGPHVLPRTRPPARIIINHHETHQTSLLTSWDPLDVPLGSPRFGPPDPLVHPNIPLVLTSLDPPDHLYCLTNHQSTYHTYICCRCRPRRLSWPPSGKNPLISFSRCPLNGNMKQIQVLKKKDCPQYQTTMMLTKVVQCGRLVPTREEGTKSNLCRKLWKNSQRWRRRSQPLLLVGLVPNFDILGLLKRD